MHVMAYACKPIVLEGGNIKNKVFRLFLTTRLAWPFLHISVLRWIWLLETPDLMDSTPETHSAHNPGTQDIKVGRLNKHQGQLLLNETLCKTERKKKYRNRPIELWSLDFCWLRQGLNTSRDQADLKLILFCLLPSARITSIGHHTWLGNWLWAWKRNFSVDFRKKTL